MGLIRRVIRRKIRTPVKRAARRQLRRVSAECQVCHKRYTNPLTHTCVVKTDFGKRKRAGERRAKAEARRARRKAAADRRKAAAAERRKAARAKRSAPARRPSRPQHDYRLCRDQDCERYACVAYRDGIADCPRDHA